ncbi:TSUP family transporter [Rhodopila sp.]|uniref:TSUP family transporter n=1 Tax=Rhodopila sp. TaxID=2480087 RepID=UPI003D097C8B
MTEVVSAPTGSHRNGRWIVLGSSAALALVVFGSIWGNPGGIVIAAVFLASLGGSIGGVAFSALCGVVLFWLHLDPVRAVQIMMTCSIANQAVMTWSVRYDINWPGLTMFLFGGMIGLPLGLWLLLHADHQLYTRVLGAFLLAYGGYMLARAPAILRVQHSNLDLIAGVLSGITGTAAAFPGAPVVIWCSFKGWNKAQQRALFQPFILIMQIVSLVAVSLAAHTRTMHGNGFASSDLLCVPAGLLGTFIGLAVYRKISTRQFAIALNLLLMVAGISFLV